MSSDGSNETPQNETPLNQHYTNLHEQCGDILSRSFAHDENNSLPNAHNYISDLEDWLSILSGRTECPLIKRGLREYQFSIFLLTKGNYRHAFMALRLHLEITLNAIYLSGYEKHLRDWKSGHIDTKWYKVNDEENGILSVSFARSFNKFLQDDVESYRRLADKVYGECSRYVHGNPDTDVKIPENLSFDENVFVECLDKADTIREVVTFSLCLRYLQDFSEHEVAEISDCVREYLRHVDSITRQLP